MQKVIKKISEISKLISKDLFLCSNNFVVAPDGVKARDCGFCADNVNMNSDGLSVYMVCDNVYLGIYEDEYNENLNVKLIIHSVLGAIEERVLASELEQLITGMDNGNSLSVFKNLVGDESRNLFLCIYKSGMSDEENILDIIKSTVVVLDSYSDGNQYVVLLESYNINEDCNQIIFNMQSEIFDPGTIACSKRLKDTEMIKTEYECLEGYFEICSKYLLGEKVLNNASLLEYLIIDRLDPVMKEDLVKSVFKNIDGAMDSETIQTVDRLFKNSLNLTETARDLFIHRNTLIYRLDKIHKNTGYDLRKFDDSWIFKIAWLSK